MSISQPATPQGMPARVWPMVGQWALGAPMTRASMRAPRRFILQALDPELGHPVLEALLTTSDTGALRALIGADPDSDADLEAIYELDARELAAIEQRFGVGLNADGRVVCIGSYHSLRDVPYLVHTGYELPLLLDGRKALARFAWEYPPAQFPGEERFDRWIAQGLLIKDVVCDPFPEPLPGRDGQMVDGIRTVHFARPAEAWRIPASKLLWEAAEQAGWCEAFERLEGMLFGYTPAQVAWWIARFRDRQNIGQGGTP